jgi:hypothetical protein
MLTSLVRSLSFTALAALALGPGCPVRPAAGFEIPLPGLAGGYEAFPDYPPPDPGYPTERTVSFVFPADIVAIEQLSLVISGEWHTGEIVCSTYPWEEPEGRPFLPGLSLYFTAEASPFDFFHATIAPPDGPFTDLTGEFRSCCPPDVLEFDQLLGVEWQATLFVDAILLLPCNVTIDAWGVVDDVHLVVTGTVAASASTWAGVKRLFR